MNKHFRPTTEKEVDNERKAHHRGDGSHKRWETRKEHRERVLEQQKAIHEVRKAYEFQAFRYFRYIFADENHPPVR